MPDEIAGVRPTGCDMGTSAVGPSRGHDASDQSGARRQMIALVASALTVAFCVACDSSEAASTPPAPLPCSAIIDSSDAVPEGFEATVLDSVSFPTYELPAGVGARRGPEGTDLEGLTFWKFGLVVRAEREV